MNDAMDFIQGMQGILADRIGVDRCHFIFQRYDQNNSMVYFSSSQTSYSFDFNKDELNMLEEYTDYEECIPF